jgi:hypothetical protein
MHSVDRRTAGIHPLATIACAGGRCVQHEACPAAVPLTVHAAAGAVVVHAAASPSSPPAHQRPPPAAPPQLAPARCPSTGQQGKLHVSDEALIFQCATKAWVRPGPAAGIQPLATIACAGGRWQVRAACPAAVALTVHAAAGAAVVACGCQPQQPTCSSAPFLLQPLHSWRQLRALALGSKTSCMSVSEVLTECTQLARNGPAEMRSAW